MQSPKDEFLWPFAGRRPVMALLLMIVLVLVFFIMFPGVDIAASRLFFDPTPCPTGVSFCYRFPLADDPVLSTVRQVLHVLPLLLAVLVLLLVGARFASNQFTLASFDRAALTAVGALALGAGVLVNLLLKEHWSRPRPLVTEPFGGPFPFAPVGHVSEVCTSNCDSFVSGEAAGSFWLVGLAAILPHPYRVPCMAVAFVAAIAGSLLRVSFGGHFISDTVLAALLSLTVFALVATWARRYIRRLAEDGSLPAEH